MNNLDSANSSGNEITTANHRSYRSRRLYRYTRKFIRKRGRWRWHFFRGGQAWSIERETTWLASGQRRVMFITTYYGFYVGFTALRNCDTMQPIWRCDIPSEILDRVPADSFLFSFSSSSVFFRSRRDFTWTQARADSFYILFLLFLEDIWKRFTDRLDRRVFKGGYHDGRSNRFFHNEQERTTIDSVFWERNV